MTERPRRAERVRDLSDIKKEDFISGLEDPLANEALAHGEREPSRVRLRHAIDPVVVFFGQGAGAKRGRDDLFEPCQVIGSVRERGARPRKGLFTECAHACESRLGILTLAAQALRDDGDELRRVVSPRRAREIEGLLANVTVTVEEIAQGFSEAVAAGESRQHVRGPLAGDDRSAHGRRRARRTGKGMKVALEPLQGRRESLSYHERLATIAADELLERLSQLFHHRIRGSSDDEMDRPDSVLTTPQLEPRVGRRGCRHRAEVEPPHPLVVPL